MRTIITIAAASLLAAASASAQQISHVPAKDKVIAGSLATEFAIGAEDGEDWELLSRVMGAAFDAKDNLYVLDAGNHRVLVFDARGRFVRSIGKKGGGPGELLSPVGVAVTRDGYVAVTDLGRPGVSLFKPDGSFAKNLVLGDSLGVPNPQNSAQAHPAGGIVVRSNPLIMRARAAAEGELRGPTGPRLSPITWLKADGKSVRLAAFELPSLTPKVNEGGSANRRSVSVRISQPAFAPPTLWGVLPGGTVALADEAAYRIRLVKNGKVERVIERAIAVRKATEPDKQRARQLRKQAMKTGTGMVIAMRTDGPGGASSSISTGSSGGPRISDAEIEEQLREMTFMEHVPTLQRMVVDHKGRMWIERAGKRVGDNGPIDIIDGAGNYIGTVNTKLPAAFSPTGRAVYIERDDLDVEKVVVRKLPAAWL